MERDESSLWDLVTALMDAREHLLYEDAISTEAREALEPGIVECLRTIVDHLDPMAESIPAMRARCAWCDFTDDLAGEVKWQATLVEAIQRFLESGPGGRCYLDWDDLCGELKVLAALQCDAGREDEATATLQRGAEIAAQHGVSWTWSPTLGGETEVAAE